MIPFARSSSEITYRLLHTIEQQKKLVELELARLREEETLSGLQDWHASQAIEVPGIRAIHRQKPRVIVPQDEQWNEEHRLTKKTRANWTVPQLSSTPKPQE